MPSEKAAKCFILDLGGVLIRLAEQPRLPCWAEYRLTWRELNRWWQESPRADSFERGRCSPRDFAHGLIRDFNLPVSSELVLREFREHVAGLFPEARQILLRLRNYGTLACLSNTNALHWRRMREEMNILDCFHHLFPSHWTEYRKPEKEAYMNVMKKLRLEPADTFFFDDTADNIQAAHRLGINAFQVDGIESLKTILGQQLKIPEFT